ncbi:hypothetical protein [Streptomyces sp. NPDC007355]
MASSTDYATDNVTAPSYGVSLFLLLINFFMIVDPWSFPERIDNRSRFY